MIKLLSIPDLPQDRQLPDGVFDDLQLRRILSEKAVEILRYPCREEEILARQALFVSLSHTEHVQRVCDFRNALISLERARMLLRASKSSIETLFLKRKLLEQFLSVYQTLLPLALCGGRFAKLALFWENALAETVEAFKADICRMDGLLGQLSRADMVYTTDQIRLVKDADKPSYYERLQQAAESMGLDCGAVRAKDISVSRALSSGMEELFAAQIEELGQLYASYDNLPLLELLAYRDELDFLLEIHALQQKARTCAIPTVCPMISAERKYTARELYDISLFAKDVTAIVPNDTYFDEQTAFFFLTGANGGGKTSYLRAVGINLILFLSGCPIFARHAVIYPFAGLRTHFPADERFLDTGRLDEEKKRMELLLEQNGRDTLFLLNESFSGTDEKRGLELALQTASALHEKGAIGLFVTHFHEVESADFPMLSTVVDPTNENARTYRIARRRGERSSYAKDILKKYRLDEESLKQRRGGK